MFSATNDVITQRSYYYTLQRNHIPRSRYRLISKLFFNSARGFRIHQTNGEGIFVMFGLRKNIRFCFFVLPLFRKVALKLYRGFKRLNTNHFHYNSNGFTFRKRSLVLGEKSWKTLSGKILIIVRIFGKQNNKYWFFSFFPCQSMGSKKMPTNIIMHLSKWIHCTYKKENKIKSHTNKNIKSL